MAYTSGIPRQLAARLVASHASMDDALSAKRLRDQGTRLGLRAKSPSAKYCVKNTAGYPVVHWAAAHRLGKREHPGGMNVVPFRTEHSPSIVRQPSAGFLAGH